MASPNLVNLDLPKLAEVVGGAVGDLLPEQTGFVLVVFKPGVGMSQATNIDPATAVGLLKEFVRHAEESYAAAIAHHTATTSNEK